MIVKYKFKTDTMIPKPEMTISQLLEIHHNSVNWFLKENIDTKRCSGELLEECHHLIDKLLSMDERKQFILRNFSLYARTLFNIDNEINDFYFGLASIRDKATRKWGFIDNKLRLVIPYKYDEVEDFDPFGHAKVRFNGHWGIINKRNKFIQFDHKDTMALRFLTYEL
jgi:hypothetical protein